MVIRTTSGETRTKTRHKCAINTITNSPHQCLLLLSLPGCLDAKHTLQFCPHVRELALQISSPLQIVLTPAKPAKSPSHRLACLPYGAPLILINMLFIFNKSPKTIKRILPTGEFIHLFLVVVVGLCPHWQRGNRTGKVFHFL